MHDQWTILVPQGIFKIQTSFFVYVRFY
eukprot:Gb_27896 [translate_table: standard]